MPEPIDFDDAHLAPEPPSKVVISGVLPVPMRVELKSDENGGVVEPDYWRAELLGFRHEESEQVETPFKIEVPLSTLTRGKKGIAVVGKSRNVTLDTPEPS
jgi:hypothetical protein